MLHYRQCTALLGWQPMKQVFEAERKIKGNHLKNVQQYGQKFFWGRRGHEIQNRVRPLQLGCASSWGSTLNTIIKFSLTKFSTTYINLVPYSFQNNTSCSGGAVLSFSKLPIFMKIYFIRIWKLWYYYFIYKRQMCCLDKAKVHIIDEFDMAKVCVL